jgi:1-acyl-sn-glycerol-3-phosphate acyltransferase
MMRGWLARVAGAFVTGFARLVTGVRGNWIGCTPSPEPRIYFANHVSHGDFVLIWTVLPAANRSMTRPVAAAEYWNATAARRFLGHDVFNAVLIARDPVAHAGNPVFQMTRALDGGSSLILFPEGTRNTGDELLLPFKAGLYHLSRKRPDVDLVPVWVENLNRVMPKGEFLPIPLLCTVSFGSPIRLADGEDKDAFLARARNALLALAAKETGR